MEQIVANFFALFDLAPGFTLDLNDLEKRYFTVQRTCHPDRLAGKPASVRQQAILRSMQANEAFESLKNPLQRARHLLALQGIAVGGESDSVKPSPELLMDIMELREALEEADSLVKVEKIKAANASAILALHNGLSSAFNAHDWQKAAQMTIKLGYLMKMEEEIRLKEKAAKN